MIYYKYLTIAIIFCLLGCPSKPKANYNFSGRVCYDRQIGNMGLLVSGIVECRDCPAEGVKIYISASRSLGDSIEGLTSVTDSNGKYSMNVASQLAVPPQDYYYLLLVDGSNKVIADYRLVPGSLDLDFRRNTVFLPWPESKDALKQE